MFRSRLSIGSSRGVTSPRDELERRFDLLDNDRVDSNLLVAEQFFVEQQNLEQKPRWSSSRSRSTFVKCSLVLSRIVLRLSVEEKRFLQLRLVDEKTNRWLCFVARWHDELVKLCSSIVDWSIPNVWSKSRNDRPTKNPVDASRPSFSPRKLFSSVEWKTSVERKEFALIVRTRKKSFLLFYSWKWVQRFSQVKEKFFSGMKVLASSISTVERWTVLTRTLRLVDEPADARFKRHESE